MKWLGQYIQDLPSRFRSDVYLEDISTGTIVSGAHLGLDSNNKIVKAVDGGGDLTSIVAGTGLSGTSLTGPIPTLNVDASIPEITTLAGLAAIGAAGATLTTTSYSVLDVNRTEANSSLAENITALHVDFDRGIDLDVTSASLGTSSLYGMDIDVDGTTNGTSTACGMTLDVWGAETNIGMLINTAGTHIKLGSGAPLLGFEPADYATIAVANTGDLTIATHGEGSDTDSDLTLSADGQIKIKPVAGRNILLDSTIAVDAGVVTGATSITSTAFVGALTGQADTVATIAGLAPNTATTQATQPNIDSIGTDGDTLGILGDKLQMYNTTANYPWIELQNRTDDASGPIISFTNNRQDSGTQAGEDNDVLGKMLFLGYNDGTPALKTYSQIYSDIHDATTGEESGRLTLGVANHDGGMGSGLILTGGIADNTIDATIGLGTASVTTVAGDLVVTSDLTVNGDTLTFESANADDPKVIIKNTTADNQAARLQFQKDRGAAMVQGDRIGEIDFIGEDADQNLQQYAKMMVRADVVTGGQESGQILLQVANHDGGLETGFTLEGGSEDGEIDVTVGLGANSVVTVPGILDAQKLRPTGQIVLMRAAFKDDIGTDKHYIPLQSELEQTLYYNEMNSFPAPYPGKLLKVMYRASGGLSGGDVSIRLESIPRNGAFLTTPTVLETVVITGPTNNTTDPNMITADFVDGSGTNAFVAGDQIMVSVQYDTDVTGGSSRHFFTLVFEFDFSSLA